MGAAMLKRFVLLPVLVAVTLAPFVSVRADDSRTTKVNGEVIQRDGVRVLRVWGDARQRGFAQGWLLAKDIRGLTDSFIRTFKPMGGAKGFKRTSFVCKGIMTLEKPYETEIR